MKIYTCAELAAQGQSPELLFWVGCAGSFDSRAQKITLALSKILDKAGVNYAILGNEESCTGDPARRAGNEFIFQTSAIQNIETMKMYSVQKIVTACPHCYNTLKNEYPELGGNYEVMHHTELIQKLIDEGKITIEGGAFKGKKIAYHDSCYLGRINGIYEAPRNVLNALDAELAPVEGTREKGFCCGAGGAQVFKEEEPGDNSVNGMRVDQLSAEKPDIIAANCPYCILMLSDGLKSRNLEDKVQLYDLSELIVENNKW